MDKVIYSKFSNERNEQYNIRTDICLNEEGTRYVRKTWNTPAAQQHIANTAKAYHQLESIFRSSPLAVNRMKEDGKYLKFQFLEGETMEHYLDGHLLEEDFWNTLHSYIDEMRRVYGTEAFVSSHEFEDFFGQYDFPEGTKGSSYVDVDLIFPNIIMNEQGWNVIDYEWTFPYMIPVNYLIYRSLFFYKYRNGIDALPYPLDKLLEEIGITQEEIRIYQNMEQHFHQSVFAEVETTSDIVHRNEYERTMELPDLLKEHYGTMGIGYHTKTAFTEENEMHKEVELELPLFMNHEQLRCQIPVTEGVNAVTVEFRLANTAIVVDSIIGRGTGGERPLEATYSQCSFSNGRLLLSRMQYPVFTIPLGTDRIEEIEIVGHTAIMCEENAKAIVDAIHEVQDETIRVRQQYQNQLDAMKDSTSWRCTGWLRKLGELKRH